MTSREASQGMISSRRSQERRPSRDTTTPSLRPALPHKASIDASLDPIPEQVRRQTARLQSSWRCSLLTLITSFAAVVLLVTIVNSFVNLQQDPKGCAMSYMMPMFARFSDFDTEHTRFASKYSLYLYREGGVDEDTRVKGIPVLFIPGNAGSYKQVRPIAAEAAHYFHDVLRENPEAIAHGKQPLDFFTVDFNEELAAFHGQTLLDQAEYLNEAVAYILALYHNPQRSLREPGLPDPKSVIILGHSMGGAVARTMLRMPNYQEKTINTILTLSTPHARPPLSFDATMVATYNDVNTFWRQSFLSPSGKNPLEDITLVSVAGGGLDTMIPSEYTSVSSLMPETHGFTVYTSSIPNVWTGMDHLAIMWCDQFRKALVRAIFDVVDVRRPSQTLSRPERMHAFRKRLLTGLEPMRDRGVIRTEAPVLLTLEQSFTTTLAPGSALALRSLGDVGTTRAHLLPVPSQPFPQGSKFTLLTDQPLASVDDGRSLAVYLCSVTPQSYGSSMLSYASTTTGKSVSAMKLACRNAASDVSLLPASRHDSQQAFDGTPPFSYLQYDLSSISDYQFIAVLERPSDEPRGWLFGEFSSAADSTIHIDKGHHQLLMHSLTIELPAGRPLMTEVKIPEIHSTLFAYRLGISRTSCEPAEEKFAPLLRQYIAEPHESKFFVNVRGGNINVHGLSPYMPPPLRGSEFTAGLSLQLWTDPSCGAPVEMTLKVDVLGSLGKLVMRYRTMFAAFPVLVIALVLRKQFKVYDNTGIFMSFTQSMDQCIRTSLPAIFMALTFFGITISQNSRGGLSRGWLYSGSTNVHEPGVTPDFAVNDLLLGTPDPFFWFLVPLFAIISVGICIVANYLVLAITHILAWVSSFFTQKTSSAATDEPVSGGPGRKSSTSLRADEVYSKYVSLAEAPGVGLRNGLGRRLLVAGLLVLTVVTIVPYQFAYIALCVIQLTTAVRALCVTRTTLASTPTSSPSSKGFTPSTGISAASSHATTKPLLPTTARLHNSNFANYTHSLLLLLLWIIPINAPVLVVWARNLAANWLAPFDSPSPITSSAAAGLMAVAGILAVVEAMRTGRMVPRAPSRGWRLITNLGLFALALYAAVFGVSFAYRMHFAVNALAAWLAALHLFATQRDGWAATWWAEANDGGAASTANGSASSRTASPATAIDGKKRG